VARRGVCCDYSVPGAERASTLDVHALEVVQNADHGLLSYAEAADSCCLIAQRFRLLCIHDCLRKCVTANTHCCALCELQAAM